MFTFKKALFAAAALALSASSAFAYTVDPQVNAGTKIIPARTCEAAQDVCYVRVTVNFNDASINNGVWFATLPKNAYILGIDAYVTTAFSTGTLTMGATKTGADFLAGSGGTSGTTFIPLTSTGVFHLTTAAGLGLAATGGSTAQPNGCLSTLQTQINCAIPVYIRQVTAATTGQVTIVITFAKDNDN